MNKHALKQTGLMIAFAIACPLAIFALIKFIPMNYLAIGLLVILMGFLIQGYYKFERDMDELRRKDPVA